MEKGKQPAYPSEGFLDQAFDSGMTHSVHNGFMQFHGLSKREYFAGLAMQGAVTVANLYQNGEHVHCYYAKMCVEMADALLEELAKDQKL